MDPVPDPLLLRKSGRAGNRTRDLCICSQKLWPLVFIISWRWFHEEEFFWTLYQVSCVPTTHFFITGQNILSSFRNRRISCGLVSCLALCSAKCVLPVALHRAFNYHRTQYSNCEKKSRGRNVDCMNQAHMTRNSNFEVKANVLLYRPSEGCRSLRLPGPLDKPHMKVGRWSAPRIGRIYP